MTFIQSDLPVLNSIAHVWVQDSRVTTLQVPAISNVTVSKASKVVPELVSQVSELGFLDKLLTPSH